MMNRRDMLQGVTAGFGAALGVSMLPDRSLAAPTSNGKPRRIIFFLQNQGFDTATAVPTGLASGSKLSDAKLPEPVKDLEPYQDRINIITGLHGRHTSP